MILSLANLKILTIGDKLAIKKAKRLIDALANRLTGVTHWLTG